MSFDKATRTLLANQVGKARETLKSDVIVQLRRYGFQEDGTVLPLEQIAGLSEAEQAAASQLRELLEHLYASEHGNEQSRRRAAYDRLAREIGFTTLNRLVALLMAEERGLIVESVGHGVNSDGFQLFDHVANGALGDRATTYRAYIESLYDEIAVDLPALFDRGDPHSQVFPSERCLEEVLGLLNGPEIAHVWKADEAIGWVYQYYNDPDERRKMREHPAPRNSRELAVRNQFFTPRYVVEFLTDNTLGRIWYEMRLGETRLVDECQYMVRRKHPIWLAEGQVHQRQYDPERDGSVWGRTDDDAIWLRPNPDPESGAEYARTIQGYQVAARLFPNHITGPNEPEQVAHAIAKEVAARERATGKISGTFEELRIAEFVFWRLERQSVDPEPDPIQNRIHAALCAQWELEVEEIPHRAKKDPRQLKVVDLAVGSGHFLLYTFDLLQTIYEEAWDDSDLGPDLQLDYPDRAAYVRDVPQLILEQNLYGVDIDWRAAQIAQVALWLRAQRAWVEAGLASVERPRVRRTGIVVAEPMPEGGDLLVAAKRRLDSRLHELIDLIWQKMRLAGEAGSLLKIEDVIREAVRSAAQKVGVVESAVESPNLGMPGLLMQTRLSVSPTADEVFFWVSEAEKAVLEALQIGAEAAEECGAIRRRLFSNSAASGFAFVDLCQLQFDVALMNPPFGAFTSDTLPLIRQTYSTSSNDIFAAFVDRALSLVTADGMIGVVSSRTGFFLSSFSAWRRETILGTARLRTAVDLGPGVMDDATVEAAAYTLAFRRTAISQPVFIRALAARSKEMMVQTAVAALATAELADACFLLDEAELRNLKGSPIVYWVDPAVVRTLTEHPTFEPAAADVRQGLVTGDNPRFVRLTWEVAPKDLIAARGAGRNTRHLQRIANELTGEHSRGVPGFCVRTRRAAEILPASG